MHLYDSLQKKVPVIGVAKNPFKDVNVESELLRGNSLKPLYITSVGYPLSQAKKCISLMAGKNRIPSLLKKVDRLCRGR